MLAKPRLKKKKKLVSDKRMEKEFKRYQNIARKLASKFSHEYRKPYHQMVEVAEYALALELFGRMLFDKNHGAKKSSWLYTVIFFHLKQVCTRGVHPCPKYPGSMQVRIREWVPEIPFSSLKKEDLESIDPEQKPSMVSKLFSDLGEEARLMVRTVLEAPNELKELITTGRGVRAAREAVRTYMIDELDWTTDEVDKIWSEIQEGLK